MQHLTDPPYLQRLEIAESETVVAKTELHLALKRIEDFQVTSITLASSQISTAIVQMAISSDMDSDSGGSTLQYLSDEVRCNFQMIWEAAAAAERNECDRERRSWKVFWSSTDE